MFYLICILTGMVLLLALPLLGVLLDGRDIAPYLEFPPLTRYVPHAGFSLPVFLMLSLVFLGVGFLLIQFFRKAKPPISLSPSPHPFPWWGWMGGGIILWGWILAWNRFPWAAPVQHHTFLPLWLGYILVVNALCLKRSASSLLTDAPGRFCLLFPASSLFWWFFEYLNRFVQNWYYLDVAHFSPGEYVLFATLSFSTVLPAVLSTARLLLTFPAFEGLTLSPVRIRSPRKLSAVILSCSGTGLFLLGRFPDQLFPLVWLSPLLLVSSIQMLLGRRTIFSPLARGDYRLLLSSAMGALVCGFFWEMWNSGSLAKWEYGIPYVHRFLVFEMPILGYLGYLPFGLECGLIGAAGMDLLPPRASESPVH